MDAKSFPIYLVVFQNFTTHPLNQYMGGTIVAVHECDLADMNTILATYQNLTDIHRIHCIVFNREPDNPFRKWEQKTVVLGTKRPSLTQPIYEIEEDEIDKLIREEEIRPEIDPNVKDYYDRVWER